MRTSLDSAFCLIGDIVASRRSGRAGERLAELRKSLEMANQRADRALRQPLSITIGDEFQGVFTKLGAMLDAALVLHLDYAHTGRLRFGFGHGPIEFDDATRPLPLGQTGQGWYRARAAIDKVKSTESSKRAYRKSAYSSNKPETDALVNAYLMLQDRVLGEFDERDAKIALGLLKEETQSDIAARIGIDAAAVTRRKYSNRIDALIDAATSIRARQ